MFPSPKKKAGDEIGAETKQLAVANENPQRVESRQRSRSFEIQPVLGAQNRLPNEGRGDYKVQSTRIQQQMNIDMSSQLPSHTTAVHTSQVNSTLLHQIQNIHSGGTTAQKDALRKITTEASERQKEQRNNLPIPLDQTLHQPEGQQAGQQLINHIGARDAQGQHFGLAPTMQAGLSRTGRPQNIDFHRNFQLPPFEQNSYSSGPQPTNPMYPHGSPQLGGPVLQPIPEIQQYMSSPAPQYSPVFSLYSPQHLQYPTPQNTQNYDMHTPNIIQGQFSLHSNNQTISFQGGGDARAHVDHRVANENGQWGYLDNHGSAASSQTTYQSPISPAWQNQDALIDPILGVESTFQFNPRHGRSQSNGSLRNKVPSASSQGRKPGHHRVHSVGTSSSFNSYNGGVSAGNLPSPFDLNIPPRPPMQKVNESLYHTIAPPPNGRLPPRPSVVVPPRGPQPYQSPNNHSPSKQGRNHSPSKQGGNRSPSKYGRNNSPSKQSQAQKKENTGYEKNLLTEETQTYKKGAAVVETLHKDSEASFQANKKSSSHERTQNSTTESSQANQKSHSNEHTHISSDESLEANEQNRPSKQTRIPSSDSSSLKTETPTKAARKLSISGQDVSSSGSRPEPISSSNGTTQILDSAPISGQRHNSSDGSSKQKPSPPTKVSTLPTKKTPQASPAVERRNSLSAPPQKQKPSPSGRLPAMAVQPSQIPRPSHPPSRARAPSYGQMKSPKLPYSRQRTSSVGSQKAKDPATSSQQESSSLSSELKSNSLLSPAGKAQAPSSELPKPKKIATTQKVNKRSSSTNENTSNLLPKGKKQRLAQGSQIQSLSHEHTSIPSIENQKQNKKRAPPDKESHIRSSPPPKRMRVTSSPTVQSTQERSSSPTRAHQRVVQSGQQSSSPHPPPQQSGSSSPSKQVARRQHAIWPPNERDASEGPQQGIQKYPVRGEQASQERIEAGARQQKQQVVQQRQTRPENIEPFSERELAREKLPGHPGNPGRLTAVQRRNKPYPPPLTPEDVVVQGEFTRLFQMAQEEFPQSYYDPITIVPPLDVGQFLRGEDSNTDLGMRNETEEGRHQIIQNPLTDEQEGYVLPYINIPSNLQGLIRTTQKTLVGTMSYADPEITRMQNVFAKTFSRFKSAARGNRPRNINQDLTRAHRDPPAPLFQDTALGKLQIGERPSRQWGFPMFGDPVPQQMIVEELYGCTFCLYECDFGISDESVWLPVEASGGYCHECYISCNDFADKWTDWQMDHKNSKTPEGRDLWERMVLLNDKQNTPALKELADDMNFKTQAFKFLHRENNSPHAGTRATAVRRASISSSVRVPSPLSNGGSSALVVGNGSPNPRHQKRSRVISWPAAPMQSPQKSPGTSISKTPSTALTTSTEISLPPALTISTLPDQITPRVTSPMSINPSSVADSPMTLTESPKANSTISEVSRRSTNIQAIPNQIIHPQILQPPFLPNLAQGQPSGSRPMLLDSPLPNSSPSRVAQPSPYTEANATQRPQLRHAHTTDTILYSKKLANMGPPPLSNARRLSSSSLPPPKLELITPFCRSSPWRRIDETKARICGPCRDKKFEIVSHTRHREFILLNQVPRRMDKKGYPLLEDAKRKGCMVCPKLAIYKCKSCPLVVCTDCNVALEKLCKGEIGGLLIHLHRVHLRNDAFLLVS